MGTCVWAGGGNKLATAGAVGECVSYVRLATDERHTARRAWNLTCVCLALAGWGNVLQEVREVEFFPNRASRGFAFFSLCEPQIVSIPRELEW